MGMGGYSLPSTIDLAKVAGGQRQAKAGKGLLSRLARRHAGRQAGRGGVCWSGLLLYSKAPVQAPLHTAHCTLHAAATLLTHSTAQHSHSLYAFYLLLVPYSSSIQHSSQLVRGRLTLRAIGCRARRRFQLQVIGSEPVQPVAPRAP